MLFYIQVVVDFLLKICSAQFLFPFGFSGDVLSNAIVACSNLLGATNILRSMEVAYTHNRRVCPVSIFMVSSGFPDLGISPSIFT